MATHREVAQNWARQTGRKQRGYHMFYEGRSIYSYGYHFELGRLVDSPQGLVVLLNSASRSISTTRHQSITWRAAYDAGFPTFSVPFVEDHNANIEYLEDRIETIIDSGLRCQGRNIYWKVKMAENAFETYSTYCSTFGLVPFLSLTSLCRQRGWPTLAELIARRDRLAAANVIPFERRA